MGVQNALRTHFDKKNSEGNKRGWVRSNFWSKIVKRGTVFTGATENEATVTIASREFVHKLRGGTVRAKSGRMLAIPLTNQAKAKGSPGDWTVKGDGKLSFVKTPKGAFLIYNRGFRSKNGLTAKGQKGEAWYKLVASVRHLADPTALPPMAELEVAAMNAARDQIDKELRRRGF